MWSGEWSVIFKKIMWLVMWFIISHFVGNDTSLHERHAWPWHVKLVYNTDMGHTLLISVKVVHMVQLGLNNLNEVKENIHGITRYTTHVG